MGKIVTSSVSMKDVKECLDLGSKISFYDLVARVAKKLKKAVTEIADDVWKMLLSMRAFAKEIDFVPPIQNLIEDLSEDESGRKGKSKRVLVKASQEARNNTMISYWAIA